MPDDQSLPTEDAASEDEDMPLPHDPKTIFLGGLFLLAVLAAMYIARTVILPIVLALVLKLLLQPLVRLLEQVRIPKGIGALLAILLLVGVFAVLGGILSSPAGNLVRDFPQTLQKLQDQIALLKAALEHLHPVLGLFGISGAGPAANPAEMLNLNPGRLAGAVAAGASGFASHLLETLLILFYMLVFGETFMRRVVEILPRFRDKRQAVEISEAIERDISVYLLTITVINAVVGVAAGVVMWLFGVPGAPLWGVAAFCLNYVPILGPFTGVALFVVIGLATLGGSWYAVLPAACYLGIHLLEGELFTPMVLARRFTLNPILVMIALVFWYWMWGVQGAILSVPLLAITKIVCDRLRPFRALGHLLEG